MVLLPAVLLFLVVESNSSRGKKPKREKDLSGMDNSTIYTILDREGDQTNRCNGHCANEAALRGEDASKAELVREWRLPDSLRPKGGTQGKHEQQHLALPCTNSSLASEDVAC